MARRTARGRRLCAEAARWNSTPIPGDLFFGPAPIALGDVFASADGTTFEVVGFLRVEGLSDLVRVRTSKPCVERVVDDGVLYAKEIKVSPIALRSMRRVSK